MIKATVSGTKDFREALTSIPDKLRRRALLNALKKGGRVVQAAARARAPVLSSFNKTPYRKAGVLRKAISVRTSKQAKRAGDVGVFVNVRPAGKLRVKTTKATATRMVNGKLVKGRAGSQKALGRGTLDDAFYWRFVNFKTRSRPGTGFLEAGAAKLPQALTVIEADLGPQIERLNRGGKGL